MTARDGLRVGPYAGRCSFSFSASVLLDNSLAIPDHLMKPRAVVLAKNKLAVFVVANQTLQSATSFATAEVAWSAIILAHNVIYSKLEQGSKGNKRSEQWFERQKHRRRKDPLLSYLHYARNVDEHGLEFITHRNVPHIGSTPIPENRFGQEIPVTFHKVDEYGRTTGPEIKGTIAGPNLILVRVTDDRFKDSRNPPTEHLGCKIKDPTPQVVAKLALEFSTKLIGEAEQLAKPL